MKTGHSRLSVVALLSLVQLQPSKDSRQLHQKIECSDDDDDEIAYFTVRWKTRASFVYRTKNMR